MNYARYFSKDQKVFLINISSDREQEHFEALNGFIVDCGGDFFDVGFSYGASGDEIFAFREGMLFKMSSESFGVGVQLSAEFVGKQRNGIFRFKPTGNMELFQRRQVPRMDLTLPICTVRKQLPPGELLIEWKRLVKYVQKSGAPPQISFVKRPINLSAGGVRFEISTASTVSDLRIIFVDLEDSLPPICAIAEVVWVGQSETEEEILCGNRFINILKADQQRLVNYVVDHLKAKGAKLNLAKNNWELLDRMIYSHE